MVTYLINQAILVAFNLVNVKIDAFRITKHKVIAHGINLIAYGLFCALLIWIFKMNFWETVLFCLSAFFNRNIVFDAALNKRRGLSIFYVSTAEPPKAWWDRVERSVFGFNGKLIMLVYLIGWLITTFIIYVVA